jgi:hypothetical protein
MSKKAVYSKFSDFYSWLSLNDVVIYQSETRLLYPMLYPGELLAIFVAT